MLKIVIFHFQVRQADGGKEVRRGRDGRHRVHGVRKSEAQTNVVSFFTHVISLLGVKATRQVILLEQAFQTD